MALHAENIVHRDVKPSNIIVIDDRATLHDFDCTRDGSSNVKCAGTEAVQIRRLFYEPTDDLVSLCLCFASLVLPEWRNDNSEKLLNLHNLAHKLPPFQLVSDNVSSTAHSCMSLFLGVSGTLQASF